MDGPLRSISPWPAAAMMLVVLLLTSCDGYIEQVRVDEGGSVEFAAEATVVCGDELQAALWDEAPCDAIDRAVRGEAIARLPFDFVVDDRRLGLVADGEQDRRRIDATWEGTIDELDTLLVSDASIRSLGDGEVEVVFTPAGAPQDVLASSDELSSLVNSADWPDAEFRVIAPELVVEHNGDDIQGRTVVWRLDGDVPSEFRLVWSGESRGLRVWWWIVGGAILTAILFMMITLEGRTEPGRTGGAPASSDESSS